MPMTQVTGIVAVEGQMRGDGTVASRSAVQMLDGTSIPGFGVVRTRQRPNGLLEAYYDGLAPVPAGSWPKELGDLPGWLDDPPRFE